MTDAELLAELAVMEAQLARLKAAVSARIPASPVDDTGADDFDEANMMTVQRAAAESPVPEDTLRYWLRHPEAGPDCLGRKTGNVWQVSRPRLQRWLAAKRPKAG